LSALSTQQLALSIQPRDGLDDFELAPGLATSLEKHRQHSAISN